MPGLSAALSTSSQLALRLPREPRARPIVALGLPARRFVAMVMGNEIFSAAFPLLPLLRLRPNPQALLARKQQARTSDNLAAH